MTLRVKPKLQHLTDIKKLLPIIWRQHLLKQRIDVMKILSRKWGNSFCVAVIISNHAICHVNWRIRRYHLFHKEIFYLKTVNCFSTYVLNDPSCVRSTWSIHSCKTNFSNNDFNERGLLVKMRVWNFTLFLPYLLYTLE